MLSRLAKFLYPKEGKVDRSLVLLALSLSCGIAALVALETFSRRVEGTVSRDSKKVLAADYQVRSWRPFDEKVWEAVAEEKAQGHTVLLKDFVSSLSYSVDSKVQIATVSARAIEGTGYPFYGDFVVEPQLTLESLDSEPGIFLDKSFKARGVNIGDSVQLGEATFKVLSFIVEEPQAIMGAFSLGPRVMLSTKWLESTKLVQAGSRIYHQLLIKTSLGTEEFETKFRAKAPDLHWRIRTPEGASRQVERVLDRMRGFLSFVGISSLFLGAMGLFMVFRSQFLRKLPSYLTLRCIGAKGASIVQIAILTSLQVALLGSFMGIFLGLTIEEILVYFARNQFQAELGSVSWLPSIAWGVLLSLLCVGVSVFLPLREVLRVPVSNAIRQDEAGMSELSRKDAFIAFLVAVFIVLIVGPKLKMSFLILVGIIFAVLLLLAMGRVFLKSFVAFARGLTLRHAYLQLERKKGRTQLLVIAFGMSLFFLFLILFLGSSLRQQIARVNQSDIPNLFALSVPSELREPLGSLLPSAEFVPFAQARIVELKGREVLEGEVPQEGAERFYQTREYVITKRNELSKGEELVGAENLFGAPQEGLQRISLEEDFADRLQIKVGEKFQVDLAGVRLNTVVTSLRKVNWFNFQPNFFMVFNADDLEGAPMDFIAMARVPSDQIADYQTRIAKELPQITLIDGEALASRLLKVLNQLSLAVYSVTLFSLMGCCFVFIGIFLARRSEIAKEVALWRCLGLRNNKILGIYVFESMFLGLLASISSFFAALIVVYGLCRWVIDIPMELISAQAIIALLLVPALLSVLGVWLLLRRSFSKSSQALFRLAEETF